VPRVPVTGRTIGRGHRARHDTSDAREESDDVNSQASTSQNAGNANQAGSGPEPNRGGTASPNPAGAPDSGNPPLAAPAGQPGDGGTVGVSSAAAPTPPTAVGPVAPAPTDAGVLPGAEHAGHVPGTPRRDALRGVFQGPADRPRPRMRLLAAACGWAVTLCVGGVGAGVWALVTLLSGAAAGWFQPTIIAVGVIGLALTASAFPLLERRILPWLLLGLATLTLIGGYILTASTT
jgi:hypothetical protein